MQQTSENHGKNFQIDVNRERIAVERDLERATGRKTKRREKEREKRRLRGGWKIRTSGIAQSARPQPVPIGTQWTFMKFRQPQIYRSSPLFRPTFSLPRSPLFPSFSPRSVPLSPSFSLSVPAVLSAPFHVSEQIIQLISADN